MNDNNTKNNIDEMLEKIKSEEVRMKPKAYFTAKAVGLVIVVALTLIVSALVLSYLLFSIRVSGEFFLLGFGREGWYAFFTLFPWAALVIDLLLLIALDWLLQQFRFGYRMPLIYLGIGTLLLTLFFSVLINATPFHGAMMQRADHQQLPVIGGFYQGLDQQPASQEVSEGIFQGTVLGVQNGSILMQAGGTTWNVQPETDPGILSQVKAGDEIFVAGTTTRNVIHAYGIQDIASQNMLQSTSTDALQQ